MCSTTTFGPEDSIVRHSGRWTTFDSVRCFAVVWLVACHVAVPAAAQQILFPGATWETGTPASVWVDSDKLNAAVRILPNPEETMVIQSGRVLWQGNNVDCQQHVFSVTKTYASTALGLLIDDGTVTLDTHVSEYVPAMETDYPDTTLRHFVTQTSGYVAKGEAIPLDLREPEDPYAPGTPLFTPSGSQFAYTGAAMDMFAYTLALAAGQTLEDLFTNRIANAIQMDADTWDWRGFETKDGTYVDGGSGYLDRGMAISAANAARLGLLFLARGNWDGEQLLSTDWIDLATQVQVPNSVPRHPQSAVGGPGIYGYGWWVFPDGWFEAAGYQNNYISVNLSTGTVVVSLGTESGGNSNINAFKSRLRQAMIPAVWDGLGDGRWDELDATTSKPRWTTEDGMSAEVFPTANATIRLNSVTVTDYLRTGDIRVENGGRLHITETSDFGANGHVEVDQGSVLLIEGSANVASIILEGASSLVLGGSVSVGQLEAVDSTITVRDTDEPVRIGNRFRLDGDSELRFLVADDDWGATIRLATRRALSLSGVMRVELAPDLDPKQLNGKTINLFDWVDGAQLSTEFAEILVPTRVQVDASRLYIDGDISIVSVLDKPTSAGDFNGDSVLDIADIDSLSARIRIGSADLYFDLDDDEQVNASDLVALVEGLIGSHVGDVNLDGQTDFTDFLVLSTNYGRTGGWAEGDMNGDGEVGFPDFLALSASFGIEAGVVTSVPEPVEICLAMAGIFTLIHFHGRRGS